MTEQERNSLTLTEKVVKASEEAAAAALERHRRLGQPIAILRDGQVVWIPASEILTHRSPSNTIHPYKPGRREPSIT